MTLPVLNLLQPLVDSAGKILQPWNSFFQQFTQAPSATIDIAVDVSPFVYEVKEPGQIALHGGAITTITLTRGRVSVDVTGQKLFTVGIKDTVTVVYTILPTLTFFPQF